MAPWKLVQAVLSPKSDELALQQDFSSVLRKRHIDFRSKSGPTKIAKLIREESFKILKREWIDEPERDLRELYRWS
jgi:hypothetical protein